MSSPRPPRRRRRRTTGFVPRIAGNQLFVRCLEELEKHLSPRRSGEALLGAISQLGATPENVTLGHLVRAVDLTLVPALEEHCDHDEAVAIAGELSNMLDSLAREYFAG